jgi:hypothetical protein
MWDMGCEVQGFRIADFGLRNTDLSKIFKCLTTYHLPLAEKDYLKYVSVSWNNGSCVILFSRLAAPLSDHRQ